MLKYLFDNIFTKRDISELKPITRLKKRVEGNEAE